jgi:hypothetical protein
MNLVYCTLVQDKSRRSRSRRSRNRSGKVIRPRVFVGEAICSARICLVGQHTARSMHFFVAVEKVVV